MFTEMMMSASGGGTFSIDEINIYQSEWSIRTDNAIINVGAALSDTQSSRTMYVGIIENGVYKEHQNIGDARKYTVTYENGVYTIKYPSTSTEPQSRCFVKAMYE